MESDIIGIFLIYRTCIKKKRFFMDITNTVSYNGAWFIED